MTDFSPPMTVADYLALTIEQRAAFLRSSTLDEQASLYAEFQRAADEALHVHRMLLYHAEPVQIVYTRKLQVTIQANERAYYLKVKALLAGDANAFDQQPTETNDELHD
jgi:hypothetical protein